MIVRLTAILVLLMIPMAEAMYAQSGTYTARMRVEGVSGTSAKYPGYIDLLDVDPSGIKPQNFDAARGIGGGTVRMDLTVTKMIDAATPRLMTMSADTRNVGEILVEILHPAGEGGTDTHPSLVYRLTDAVILQEDVSFVPNQEPVADNADVLPAMTETLTMSFRRVEVTYLPLSGNPTGFSFDFSNNRVLKSGSIVVTNSGYGTAEDNKQLEESPGVQSNAHAGEEHDQEEVDAK